MTKVYIVTSGSYSDYSIRAVFLDKAAAEAWVAEYNERKEYADGLEIEEWDADQPRIELPGCYECVVTKDGAVVESESGWEPSCRATDPSRRIDEYWSGAPPMSGLPHFKGYGQTLEHARRSAEELRRATLTGNIVDA